MQRDRNDFYANLFYSYSHKDAGYRQHVEDALTQLKNRWVVTGVVRPKHPSRTTYFRKN